MKADRVSEVIARESEGLETPVDLIEVATVAISLFHEIDYDSQSKLIASMIFFNNLRNFSEQNEGWTILCCVAA